MNPLAAKFFIENPEAKYWYASPSIRFPNPQLRWRRDWESDPWPGPQYWEVPSKMAETGDMR